MKRENGYYVSSNEEKKEFKFSEKTTRTIILVMAMLFPVVIGFGLVQPKSFVESIQIIGLSIGLYVILGLMFWVISKMHL